MLFYIHLAGAIDGSDKDGIEAASVAEARRLAIGFAAEILREAPDTLWAGEEFRVVLADGRDQVLFTIRISAIEAEKRSKMH